jgi:tetratricopeptide (TPR) repeat protein
LGWANLAGAYLALNRPDEAKATLNTAFQKNLNYFGLHFLYANLEWAQGNKAEVDKQLDLIGTTGNLQYQVLGYRAGMAGAAGEIKRARELTDQSIATAKQVNLKEAGPQMMAQQADLEALVENCDQARRQATESLNASTSTDVEGNAAFALAVCGDSARSLKLADDIARRRPNDTLALYVTVPLIKALLDLKRGNPDATIDQVNTAAVYAPANSGVLYTRGMAYLKAGRGTEAAQDFQKVLNQKLFHGVDAIVPLSELGLARAYSLQGDTARSRTAYQDFFADWKDADPDVPILKQAKAEYAKIK